MKKMIFLLFLISPKSYPMTPEEEAFILNQELEFLHQSAENVNPISETSSSEENVKKSRSFRTLEETYFDDADRDSVSTRAAARRRTPQ